MPPVVPMQLDVQLIIMEQGNLVAEIVIVLHSIFSISEKSPAS